MSKLPPPYVDGSIPAQTDAGLKIPFRLNRAVSLRDVTKMYIKIKTVATDRIIGVFETTAYAKSEMEAVYLASFEAPKELTVGQFYKAQLAFGDSKGEQGYFSTVGVFKYTTTPQVYIDGMKDYEIGNLYTYTGVYDQSFKGGDPAEKEYSYQFDLYQNDNLFASSGLLLHDSTTDAEEAKSFNTWVLNEQLQEGIIYTLYYTVNTINGITKRCQYNITNNEIDDDVLQTSYKLTATNDFDNGRIILNLKATDDITLQGGFVVSRSTSKDNYSSWNEVMKFTLMTFESLPENLWIDYTVEQGVGYRYAIQRFNDSGFYSARILTPEPIIADFEDMFLFDGTRQLKIRFNPKVSSFKQNVLENKTDTIGGKYPFFFRNGDVKYKEFPISGMISHLSDTDELFLAAQEMGLPSEAPYRNAPRALEVVRSTQVDTENIAAERKFKLAVLDWLTDGEPKIFRSPAEGNYIVRIMNTSLSPNDTLSRMIHTFSSTAYEIAEFNFDNLIKYGFVENHTIDNRVMVLASIPLTGTNYRTQQNYLSNFKDGVWQAEFIGVEPGTVFHLKFLNGNGTVPIRIPSNGYYKVNIFTAPLMTIQCVSVPEHYTAPKGLIDVGYYTTASIGDFGPIRKISITDQYYQQIGHKNLTNIIDSLTNVKNKVGHIYVLKVETREDETVFYYDNRFWRGRNINGSSWEYDDEITNFAATKLYYVINESSVDHQPEWWFRGDFEGVKPPIYTKTMELPAAPSYNFNIQLDNVNPDFPPYPEEVIKLGEYHEFAGRNDITGLIETKPTGGGIYTAYDLDNVIKLSIGDGLVLDMMYQNKELIYGIEEDDAELIRLKQDDYNKFLQTLEAKLKEGV